MRLRRGEDEDTGQAEVIPTREEAPRQGAPCGETVKTGPRCPEVNGHQAAFGLDPAEVKKMKPELGSFWKERR